MCVLRHEQILQRDTSFFPLLSHKEPLIKKWSSCISIISAAGVPGAYLALIYSSKTSECLSIISTVHWRFGVGVPCQKACPGMLNTNSPPSCGGGWSDCSIWELIKTALACFSPLTSATFISVFMSGWESAGRAAAVLQIIRPAGTTFAATGFPLPRLIQLFHKSPLRHSCTMWVKRSKLRHTHTHTQENAQAPYTEKWRRHMHTVAREAGIQKIFYWQAFGFVLSVGAFLTHVDNKKWPVLRCSLAPWRLQWYW